MQRNLICPHQVTLLLFAEVTIQQSHQPHIQKLLEELLSLNAHYPTSSFAQFLDILRQAGIPTIDLQVRAQGINSLNEFYVAIAKTCLNSKLEQHKVGSGSIIQLFNRRLQLTFKKMEFKQLMLSFQNFVAYRETKSQLIVNQFLRNSKLKGFKLAMQQFSTELDCQLLQQQLALCQGAKKNSKIDYLRALQATTISDHHQALSLLHRHFDLNFSSLIPEKQDSRVSRVNHSVLGLVDVNLKLGFYDEALKGISQGLRISQNNSDQESINVCMQYLSQISGVVGNSRSQQLLIQNALQHAFKQSNAELMLVNCLKYACLHGKYNFSGVKKVSNISWTDILHMAVKKILLPNQINDKLHYKAAYARLAQQLVQAQFVPDLNNLISKFYTPKFPQLQLNTHLQKINQQFCSKDKFSKLLDLLKKKTNRGQFRGCRYVQELLARELKKDSEAHQIAFYWSYKINRLIFQQDLGQAQTLNRALQQFSQNCGLDRISREECLYNQLVINMKAQEWVQAIKVVEQLVKQAQQSKNLQFLVRARCKKAQLYLRINNLSASLTELEQLQRQTVQQGLKQSVLAEFFYTEALVIYGSCFLLSSELLLRKTDKTIRLLTQSRSMFVEEGLIWGVRDCAYALARINLSLGDLQKAQKWSREFNRIEQYLKQQRWSRCKETVQCDLQTLQEDEERAASRLKEWLA